MLIEPKIPSKEIKDKWIWAETAKPFEYQTSNEFSGKWMIFASLRRMDDGLTVHDHLWKRIQAETLLKKFYKASARTAKRTPLSRGDYSVICVHTTDYRNEGEVLLTGIKIRHILNSMDIKVQKALAYKTYYETLKEENAGLNLYKLYYSITDGTIKFLKLDEELERDYGRDYNDEYYDVIFESKLEEAVMTLLPNANTLKFRENDYLKVMNGFQTVRQHVLNNGKESASDSSSSSSSSSDSSDSELDNSLSIDVAAEQAIQNSKKRSSDLLDDADKQAVDSKKLKE